MKTKVQAKHLQPGYIVGSGEMVIGVTIRSLRMPSNKVAVTLKKDGRQRTVQWGKYTMINIDRPSSRTERSSRFPNDLEDWKDVNPIYTGENVTLYTKSDVKYLYLMADTNNYNFNLDTELNIRILKFSFKLFSC